MHVIWYTAMSMDGRLAGPGDDLSFLQSIAPHDLNEFDIFLASVDAVLVGSTTIRWLEREGHGSLPAADKDVWVLTHDDELAARMAGTSDRVSRRQGDVGPVLDEMAAAGHERVWICGGGDVAGQIARLDRIDEVIVTIAPTILGSGPALFEFVGAPVGGFHLKEAGSYGGGDSVRVRWIRER